MAKKTKSSPKRTSARGAAKSASSGKRSKSSVKKSTKRTKSAKKVAPKKKSTKASNPKKKTAKGSKPKKKSAAKKKVTKASQKTARPVKSVKAPSATQKVKKTKPASKAKRSSSEEVYTPVKVRPLPKTRLKDGQLQEFRAMLLAKRRELVGDVDNLTNEALRRSRSEASGDLSSMPIHMADIGTDNWEQEFTLGLIDNERALLKEIDGALNRIADRTYGVCVATRRPIRLARLRAKPWAKFCIEHARLEERGQA